jgi:hypothetical protein
MFERTKRVYRGCRSVYSRTKKLSKKLLSEPFFPILFIGEFVKMVSLAIAGAGPVITPAVVIMGILAAVVTLTWIFFEEISEEVDKATDAVEDSLEE